LQIDVRYVLLTVCFVLASSVYQESNETVLILCQTTLLNAPCTTCDFCDYSVCHLCDEPLLLTTKRCKPRKFTHVTPPRSSTDSHKQIICFASRSKASPMCCRHVLGLYASISCIGGKAQGRQEARGLWREDYPQTHHIVLFELLFVNKHLHTRTMRSRFISLQSEHVTKSVGMNFWKSGFAFTVSKHQGGPYFVQVHTLPNTSTSRLVDPGHMQRNSEGPICNSGLDLWHLIALLLGCIQVERE